MPKPITVAVAGATGKQGGAVARILLHRGHQVRALTRRPQSPAAAELRALGADLRKADLADGAAVRDAAEGADAFFLMATPYETGVEAEVRQASTAASAAKQAGVRHLVYSSVASADQDTGIPHFDSKREVEETTSGSSASRGRWSGRRSSWRTSSARGSSKGSAQGSSPCRCLRTDRLQMIALADIAGFVRVVLERPGEFAGKRIDLASDELTGPEMASALSHFSGSGISYAGSSLDPLRSQSADLARMWEWFDQVGYSVDVGALVRSYPEVGWHDFRQWAREQDWSVLDVAGPEQPTA